MDNFLDIHTVSLNRQGEELCGDAVKIRKLPEKTIIVLSDGLGSGVKANILATLTTEIILTMLREDIPLTDVVETVIGTLPICQERKIAYATFTFVEICHADGHFRVINFDNPPVFLIKNGKLQRPERQEVTISGKKIAIKEGHLERGDFLGLCSDGVPYAGLGTTMNLGWGWDNIALTLEDTLSRQVYAAHTVVNRVISRARQLYEDEIGDDATFVGVYVRPKNSVMVFTGPPLDESHDYIYVDKLLDFEGRKVVCGGTTGNIVAGITHQELKTQISTMTADIPPIGRLKDVDLVTEGIITMARTLENLKACQGDLSRLPAGYDGAYLLTKELLLADSVHFLVGQKVNPFYQNPLLPRNISIRRTLVDEIGKELSALHKDVQVEYC